MVAQWLEHSPANQMVTGLISLYGGFEKCYKNWPQLPGCLSLNWVPEKRSQESEAGWHDNEHVMDWSIKNTFATTRFL